LLDGIATISQVQPAVPPGYDSFQKNGSLYQMRLELRMRRKLLVCVRETLSLLLRNDGVVLQRLSVPTLYLASSTGIGSILNFALVACPLTSCPRSLGSRLSAYDCRNGRYPTYCTLLVQFVRRLVANVYSFHAKHNDECTNDIKVTQHCMPCLEQW
jgi:hypothetical protein